MGMGYASAHADVISNEHLAELVPDQFDKFMKSVSAAEALQPRLWNDLQFCLSDSPPYFDDEYLDYLEEDEFQKIFDSWVQLQLAFMKATKVEDSCLTLGVGYHSSEDSGDRYDEVDGQYFYINGLYQLTPAGKKFSDRVERKNFVQFG